MAKLNRQEANKVREAAGEIRHLRQRLEVAEARLSGFDGALVLLHAYTAPVQGVGMGEDVAWALDRMAEGEPDADVPPKPDFPGMTGSISGQARGDLHNQVEEGPAVSKPEFPGPRSGPVKPFRPDDAL